MSQDHISPDEQPAHTSRVQTAIKWVLRLRILLYIYASFIIGVYWLAQLSHIQYATSIGEVIFRFVFGPIIIVVIIVLSEILTRKIRRTFTGSVILSGIVSVILFGIAVSFGMSIYEQIEDNRIRSPEYMERAEQQFIDIARRNEQSADAAKILQMQRLVDAFVRSGTKMNARLGRQPFTLVQRDKLMQESKLVAWGIYSQTTYEAYELMLAFTEGDDVAIEFAALAERNRQSATSDRRQTLDRLTDCFVGNLGGLLKNLISNRLWTVFGDAVPVEDIVVYTNLTCSQFKWIPTDASPWP